MMSFRVRGYHIAGGVCRMGFNSFISYVTKPQGQQYNHTNQETASNKGKGTQKQSRRYPTAECLNLAMFALISEFVWLKGYLGAPTGDVPGSPSSRVVLQCTPNVCTPYAHQADLGSHHTGVGHTHSCLHYVAQTQD